MTVYLSADEVRDFNSRLTGTLNALRDFGLLDGAVMRPQASAFGQDAFPTLHEKAAALLHSLVRNHPFMDGNKRTAWVAVATFYLLNGYQVARADQGDIVSLVVDAAEGQVDVATIAATLKSWVVEFDLLPDDQ